MRRIYRVAQREYLAYVRTATFLVSALALPVSLLIATAVPVLVESLGKPARNFTIIDETARYEQELLAGLLGPDRNGRLSLDGRDYQYVAPADLDLPAGAEDRLWFLQTAVQTGELFAFVRVSAAPEAPCVVDYYTADVAADDLSSLVGRVANRVAAVQDLLPLLGDEALLERFLAGIPLRTHAVTAAGEEEASAVHVARSYAPMAFVYLLWISVIMMAGHLMSSTIEEKASRVMEVLLSAVSPFEFMFGKLVGLAAAGLTMILVWVLSGILAFGVIRNPIVQQIGLGVASSFAGATAFWFVGFFLVGFLFFASIFVSIGSVCNTIRESQALTQPIIFVIMIPLVMMPFITSNPDHIVAVAASFFPPFTPFVIMNRIPATPPPPLGQVVLAALLLVGSTWLMIRLGARIFRIGILMYGKPPTLPELLRWARRSG